MDYGKSAEKLMGMKDGTWLRHANPWSVWTRIFSGPLWFIALWSFHWIGWRAIALVALMAAWTWLNPRFFPPPRKIDAWSSKGVLGERVWLARGEYPIPPGFRRAANILSGLSALFLLIALYGLVIENFWAAFLGWHAAIVGKLWFVDRMVWLWERSNNKAEWMKRWNMESLIATT